MNNDELQKQFEKYKKSVIENTYVNQLIDNSEIAYDEHKAINGGYKVLHTHEDITKEKIKNALDSHNTDHIFNKIKQKFQEVYGFETSELRIVNNRTMNIIGASYKDNCIFFDRMLEDVLHAFFMVTIIWAKYFDNKELYGRFFNYLTAVLYAAIVDNGTYNIYDCVYIKKEIDDWTATVNLAVSCQYFCMYFCIAHEVAHNYLSSCLYDKKLNAKQEEYQADKIAYDIVLRLLTEENTSNISDNERELFEYCYLAPMMVLDFWDTLFYTDRVISKTCISHDNVHPDLKKRKESLFSIPYKDDYIFNSEDGNDVYSAFLDVIDTYKIELLYRNEKGSLKELFSYLRGEIK